MVVIGLSTITKELGLACRQLGIVVSETLVTLVASTVVNTQTGTFYVERPVDEGEARVVVEEAAKKLLSKERPGISCLQLQAAYDGTFTEVENTAKAEKQAAVAAEERITSAIANFAPKFDGDFESMTKLYRKIYGLLMQKCTSPQPVATPPKDPVVEREVAAALDSVFPRVGLRSFMALTAPEKAAQLQELCSIVLGIRVFNQHQGKGGQGLSTLEAAVEQVGVDKYLDAVQDEIEEETELCKDYVDLIEAIQDPPEGGTWDKPPPEEETASAVKELLYHRQYLSYLLNIQDDASGANERLAKDREMLEQELGDLHALVTGRATVPKEQVYPRFDSIARTYAAGFQEVTTLRTRKNLHELLLRRREEYFPRPSEAARELIARYRAAVEERAPPDSLEASLDAIPKPSGSPSDGIEVCVRLTLDTAPDFLSLPLDFQGFCIHSLAQDGQALVPGNPAIGVFKYQGRYCVFASEKAAVQFSQEPQKYFTKVREACYQHPELIHLLQVHEDFQKASLLAILQSSTSPTGMATQADAQTDTPLHFQESYIDKNYEWNEWKMRRDTLHIADIRQKTTSSTQTARSHLRRENETQVFLPKDMATNTATSQGTNPIRWKRYVAGLRGEPQPMRVLETKFQL